MARVYSIKCEPTGAFLIGATADDDPPSWEQLRKSVVLSGPNAPVGYRVLHRAWLKHGESFIVERWNRHHTIGEASAHARELIELLDPRLQSYSDGGKPHFRLTR